MTITITVSDKQVKLLKLLEDGFSQKEISSKLEMELSKVKLNIYSLQQQFDCKNSVQLVCMAIRKGII